MQENEFEKKIRLKLDELRLDPGEDVWGKVSAGIHKEKRRKRFFIFLLLCAGLAGAGILYILTDPLQNLTSVNESKIYKIDGNSSDNKGINDPLNKNEVEQSGRRTRSGDQASNTGKDSGSIKEPYRSSESHITGTDDSRVSRSDRTPVRAVGKEQSAQRMASGPGNKELASSKDITTGFGAGSSGGRRGKINSPIATSTSTEGIVNRRRNVNDPPATNGGSASNNTRVNTNANNSDLQLTITDTGNPDPVLPHPPNEPEERKAKNDSNKTRSNTDKVPGDTNRPAASRPGMSQQIPVARADTQKNPGIVPSAPVKTDSVTSVAALRERVLKQNQVGTKNWNFGFNVFAGVSDNFSQMSLFSGRGANYQANAPGSVGNSGNFPISKLSYKSSFSYGVGVYARKFITRTTGFSAGLNYHFSSATSLVGQQFNSNQTFYDQSLSSTATVGEYYGAGESTRFTNKYHLLEIPLNILIRLNRNQARAIVISAGVAPSYLISSKALHTNTNRNVYYADHSQFRKWHLQLHAGAQLNLFTQKYFNITAGPELRFGVNNIAKPATNTRQHLFSGGVSVNLNLR